MQRFKKVNGKVMDNTEIDDKIINGKEYVSGHYGNTPFRFVRKVKNFTQRNGKKTPKRRGSVKMSRKTMRKPPRKIAFTV